MDHIIIILYPVSIILFLVQEDAKTAFYYSEGNDMNPDSFK